jgi:hypothetical protein
MARIFILVLPCQYIPLWKQGGFFIAKKYLKKFKKTIDNLKLPCYNKGTNKQKVR